MAEQSDYPIGFYFKLIVNGEETSFQEVSGISKGLSVEEVASGGENRFKYRIPNIPKYSSLVLKRGLASADSELINWCKSTIDEGVINPITTQDISVSLMDAEGSVLMVWTFNNAYPVKYSVSDLSSQENEMLIETIEFAYTYFNTA